MFLVQTWENYKGKKKNIKAGNENYKGRKNILPESQNLQSGPTEKVCELAF